MTLESLAEQRDPSTALACRLASGRDDISDDLGYAVHPGVENFPTRYPQQLQTHSKLMLRLGFRLPRVRKPCCIQVNERIFGKRKRSFAMSKDIVCGMEVSDKDSEYRSTQMHINRSPRRPEQPPRLSSASRRRTKEHPAGRSQARPFLGVSR